jgi:hypothetical protein
LIEDLGPIPKKKELESKWDEEDKMEYSIKRVELADGQMGCVVKDEFGERRFLGGRLAELVMEIIELPFK